MKLTPLLLALASLSCPLHAEDWYVDPLVGDDANTGLTQGAPWRSVTHALATVPASGDVIHLAPGVYDASSGEIYPLPVRTGTRIVGDGGSEVTLLEGGWFKAAGLDSFYQLQLEGVTLRGGQTGVEVFLFHEYDVELNLADVRILDMSQHGINADAYTPWTGLGARMTAEFERVRIVGCASDGARVSASAETGEGITEFTAWDCEFSDCGGWGLVGGASSGSCCGDATVLLESCRVVGNGSGGIDVQHAFFSINSLALRDSLVAKNLGAGVLINQGSIHGSTIADNLGTGLTGGNLVSDSILTGNGDDLAGFGGTFEYSFTNDPDAPAGVGNLSGDPLLTDPASGDYRLRFGSPCVDAGDPFAAAGTDLSGLPRPLDGDLDGARRNDMGANELAPLTTSGELTLGTTVDLELWGPAGGNSVLFWRRGGVEPVISTVYGDWFLGRPRRLWSQGTTGPWPPGAVGYTVPNDPWLVGLSISFQALSTSSSGTLGLTNPVTLTFRE